MTSARRLLMFTVSALYTLTVSNSAHALVATDLAQVPLFLVQSAEPLVMLNMSNDHQLFYKAYDDWSDIDGNQLGGDPDIETTYKHSIDYYGYFDSYKCYTHDGQPLCPGYRQRGQVLCGRERLLEWQLSQLGVDGAYRHGTQDPVRWVSFNRYQRRGHGARARLSAGRCAQFCQVL